MEQKVNWGSKAKAKSSKRKIQSQFSLKLRPIWLKKGQLRIKLIEGGAKLIIFCCLKRNKFWKKNEGKIKPALIIVENLDKNPASPKISINAQAVSDYFDLKDLSMDRERIGFFHKICLNDKQNEALIFPDRSYIGSMEMVKLDLKTCKISLKKKFEDFQKFGINQRLDADIDNHGYPYKGIVVGLYPIDYSSQYRDKVSLFTFNPKTEFFRKVFVLNKFKRVEGKTKFQLHSYGKIDRKALHGKRDCLAYFRIFSNRYSLSKDDKDEANLTDVSYINFHSKKLLFRARFQIGDSESTWRDGINFPFLWNDKKRFAMRYGPRSILVLHRQRRSFEYYTFSKYELMGFDHFLGMFPSFLKPRLVEALKHGKYFEVVDLGKEFCGVYSKLTGSCFRLDEFEKEEDYFFVCFQGVKKDKSIADCLLIFPFRSE